MSSIGGAMQQVGKGGVVRPGGVPAPNPQEAYTDLKTYSGDNTYVYSQTSDFVFPGFTTGMGPSCITDTVTITGGTGWTPGAYTVVACVPTFSTSDGTRDLLKLASAPAATSTGGGVGWINGGTNLLVCGGDSIMRGNNLSAELLTAPWRTYVGLGAGTTWKVHNRAVGGRTMATVASNYAAEVSVLYDHTKTKRLFIVLGGTNDANNSATAATIYGNAKSVGLAAKSDGYQVLLCTILNRADAGKIAGFDATQAVYNGLLRGDFSVSTAQPRAFLPGAGVTYADMLIDIQANTNLQTPSDTTYFLADELHPNNAGTQEIANDCVAGISLL